MIQQKQNIFDFYNYCVHNNRNNVIRFLADKGYPLRNRNIPDQKIAAIVKEVTRENGEEFLKSFAIACHPDNVLFESIYDEQIIKLKSEGEAEIKASESKTKELLLNQTKEQKQPMIMPYVKTHIPELIIGGAVILILGALILKK